MPDNQKTKLAFWLTAYAFAVTMVGTTLPTPLYPIYQSRLGFSELMITIIYATYAVGVIFALIVFGKWSDQVGRRPLLFGGLGFSAISAVLFVTGANHLGLLLAGRIFSGLSAGIFTGTATSMVVELGIDNDRATMVATAVNMGGLGLGPLLAGVLSQYAPLPLHLCFLIDLGLVLIGFYGIWYSPETVKISDAPLLEIQNLSLPPQVRSVFIPAVIAGFAGFAVFGFFTAVAPAVIGQRLHLSNHAIIGSIVFVLFTASILGQYLLKWITRKKAMMTGCVVLIMGTGLTGAGVDLPSLALITLGAIISGVGQGLIFRSGMADIIAAAPEEQRGEVTSLFFVVLYIAISIPVIGIGFAVRGFGLRSAGVYFAIGVVLLTLIALFALVYKFVIRQDSQSQKK